MGTAEPAFGSGCGAREVWRAVSYEAEQRVPLNAVGIQAPQHIARSC